MKRKSKSRNFTKQKRISEGEEIELLNAWIESQKPESGSNPMSLPPLSENPPIGHLGSGTYSRYSGSTTFDQLPISKKTKDGLRKSKYIEMTDIQRASLPHALCGRDVLGAAKTGSGKTLAFLIPILEKLYRERWGPEDGVGCIILSPTRELAGQLFDVLKSVGTFHNFSAGLLIGGREDVDDEKQRVNELNILVCTPGRLLQHMDETPNFDCSQLQVLVLDEADRILDVGFKKALNAIISQLPKQRQTFLFSATQTKSVQDLARLSLKDPEYLSVHKESITATPSRLQQTAIIVPLEQKLDMLWSFIKSHLNSKILVFLSTGKQVKFVYETFKKLRPGIPLKCLFGKQSLERRLRVYSECCEGRSVLFATDVASRGLDFKGLALSGHDSKKGVDWVVQVDCPEDVESYIHRVGRTARYKSEGKALIFFMPSEMKMLEMLKDAKVPVHFKKANTEKLEPISGMLSALLVQYPDFKHTALRAFITYVKSIYIKKNKEIFDVTKLPIEEYSASLGLPMTPKLRFLNKNTKAKNSSKKSFRVELEISEPDGFNIPSGNLDYVNHKEELEEELLIPKDAINGGKRKATEIEDVMPAAAITKKQKLRINFRRPLGSKIVFDEDEDEDGEAPSLPPLARVANTDSGNKSFQLDKDAREEYYKKMLEEHKIADREAKLLDRERCRQMRVKKKMKLKGKGREEEEEDEEDDLSGSDEENGTQNRRNKKYKKIQFDSESEDDNEKSRKKTGFSDDSISVADQEELALKLLNSMHS